MILPIVKVKNWKWNLSYINNIKQVLNKKYFLIIDQTNKLIVNLEIANKKITDFQSQLDNSNELGNKQQGIYINKN